MTDVIIGGIYNYTANNNLEEFTMSKMREEIWEQPAALTRCFAKNAPLLATIVAAIKTRQIDSICIAARGTSDHAAVYGKYIFELVLEIPVSLAASSVFTIYHKNLKLSHTLVIGISQSGKAADVLEVINAANRQGALTISITNFPDSPLATAAKYHLACEAGLEQSVAATKTFTTELFLLANLAAEWAEDQTIKDQIALIPEGINQTLKTERLIEAKAARFRFMNECFVLARGVNYAVSLEAALKIQETNYVRAKAFATSDFQHGPIAMIDPGIPVLIFAPDGPSFSDVAAMARRLHQDQVDLIIVSNNQALLELSPTAFPIPVTPNDLISPFYNTVIAQLFACKLADVKGLDPDHPRLLHKVTITK
jgi:glucosamine--fructose-6-phosphate aminotransferase (isomerizing)